MHYAAESGCFEVYKLFYVVAEVKNPKQSLIEHTPLHLAAYNGHSDTCKFIIEREDDKNPEDTKGNTTLHLAAMQGQYDVCCLLLQT